MNLLTEGRQHSCYGMDTGILGGVTVLGMSDSLRLRALRCWCYAPVTVVVTIHLTDRYGVCYYIHINKKEAENKENTL